MTVDEAAGTPLWLNALAGIAGIALVVFIATSMWGAGYAAGVDEQVRADCASHGGVMVENVCLDARAIIPLARTE